VDSRCERQPALPQTLQPARLALKITAPNPTRGVCQAADRSAPNGLLCASQPVKANEPLADQNGGDARRAVARRRSRSETKYWARYRGGDAACCGKTGVSGRPCCAT
jgi:hypothetical protein